MVDSEALAGARGRHTGSISRRMMIIAAGWISILLLLGGIGLDRTLAGFARHANVAAYLLVGLGCETGQATHLIEGEDLEEALLVQDPFPPDHWYHQPRDILHVQPGHQTLRNQGRRAFRHVNVIVHGPGALRLAGKILALNGEIPD